MALTRVGHFARRAFKISTKVDERAHQLARYIRSITSERLKLGDGLFR